MSSSYAYKLRSARICFDPGALNRCSLALWDVPAEILDNYTPNLFRRGLAPLDLSGWIERLGLQRVLLSVARGDVHGSHNGKTLEAVRGYTLMRATTVFLRRKEEMVYIYFREY